MATLLIEKALSGMPQALCVAESVPSGTHWSVSLLAVFN